MVGSDNAFAYPYGDVTEDAKEAVAEAEIQCAFTTAYGKVHVGDDYREFSRVRVHGTNLSLIHIYFHVNNGDRIGLVGRNGAGKTTLLNMITGELTPDEGQIFIPVDLKIGYLKQRDNFDSENTVIEEINNIFEPLRKLEEDIEMCIRDRYYSLWSFIPWR